MIVKELKLRPWFGTKAVDLVLTVLTKIHRPMLGICDNAISILIKRIIYAANNVATLWSIQGELTFVLNGGLLYNLSYQVAYLMAFEYHDTPSRWLPLWLRRAIKNNNLPILLSRDSKRIFLNVDPTERSDMV